MRASLTVVPYVAHVTKTPIAAPEPSAGSAQSSAGRSGQRPTRLSPAPLAAVGSKNQAKSIDCAMASACAASPGSAAETMRSAAASHPLSTVERNGSMRSSLSGHAVSFSRVCGEYQL